MAKYFIETYGCQMNVSESDSLRRILDDNNHEEVASADEAAVVIINTCSVRKTAEQRIIGRLGYFRGLRIRQKKDVRVILMGCMAQNIGPEVKKKYSDVLRLVWGTYNKGGILDYMNRLGKKNDNFLDLDHYRFMDAEPQEKYSFKSFLPISHGCDNFCSYCIVPYVRGRELHRNASDIVENIKRLMDRGVVEVVLLGQNVNSYQDGNIRFPELLEKIVQQTGIQRLGFLTSHPKDFSQALADAIRDLPGVMKNIHLPLQSGNNRILGLMNRKYTVEDYLKKIEMIRKIPDFSLSTDMIVGFPSETEEEFVDSMEMMKSVRYHEAFMYHYNTRPGTIAEKYEDLLPYKEKLDRLSRMIALQKEISMERLKDFVGKTMPVLAETVSKKNSKEYSGRTHNNLSTVLKTDSCHIGEIIQAKIIGVRGVVLEGIPLKV